MKVETAMAMIMIAKPACVVQEVNGKNINSATSAANEMIIPRMLKRDLVLMPDTSFFACESISSDEIFTSTECDCQSDCI